VGKCVKQKNDMGYYYDMKMNQFLQSNQHIQETAIVIKSIKSTPFQKRSILNFIVIALAHQPPDTWDHQTFNSKQLAR
jgi:hypothetical protein